MKTIKDTYRDVPPLWNWRRSNPEADEFTREAKQANLAYERYLQRRGITAEEYEHELGEWLDAQD